MQGARFSIPKKEKWLGLCQIYYWIFTVLKKKFQEIGKAVITMQGKPREMGVELAVAKKAMESNFHSTEQY